jgi:drug/metabolite transporter (DMT)-like permease
MTRFRANLLLLGCAAIWGFGFLFQKSAMQHMGPFLFIALRCGIAAVAMSPMAWRECVKQWQTVDWSTLIYRCAVAGVAFFLASGLQQTGLNQATVTNSGFLTALYVIVTPFFAWWLLAQRPDARVWLGVVMSTLGTWLLGGGMSMDFGKGDWMVAASSFLWAWHVITMGQGAVVQAPCCFSAGQFVVAGALAGAVALSTEEVRAPLDFITSMQGQGVSVMVDLAYVGLLSSALTFTLTTLAMKATQPSEVAIIVSTEALFAAFGAYWTLGERLSAMRWSGAALIFAATLVVQLRSKKVR